MTEDMNEELYEDKNDIETLKKSNSYRSSKSRKNSLAVLTKEERWKIRRARREKVRDQKKRRHQIKFIEHYILTLGNVGKSCSNAGITRRTYERWREENPDFEEKLNDIRESLLDDAEEELQRMTRDRTYARQLDALKCFLGTKGRDRGYGKQYDKELPPTKIIVISSVPRPKAISGRISQSQVIEEKEIEIPLIEEINEKEE